MSRRHKEYDIIQEPLEAEPLKKVQAGLEFVLSSTSLIDKLKSIKENIGKKNIASSIDNFCKNIFKVVQCRKVEIDDEYIKIRRDYLDPDALSDYIAYRQQKTVSNRGRSLVKRLINKIEDSKIVRFFKETLTEVKKECTDLYQDMKQFCVCFFKGVFKAFSPKEDPYGKLSHYHRIISSEVDDIPSRKTLNNGYKWFVEWRYSVFGTIKEQIEMQRHKLWEELIDWICTYLLRPASQNATL